MKIISAIGSLLLSGLISAAPLHNIVVFGDSLSDNGNLYEYMKHQFPLSPPYYKGRFTNGPVWVEHLAAFYFSKDSADHLQDYAFGGAGILSEDEDDPEEGAFFTLRKEIDSYLLANQGHADENSLYIVWIGSNNYIAIPDDPAKTLHEVDMGIRNGLKRLVKSGAKKFLIVNLPDLGQTPVARDFNVVELMSSLTEQHNKKLQIILNKFQRKFPKTQWLLLDIDNMFKEVLSNPAQSGFTNVTETCYEAMINPAMRPSVLKIASSVKPKPQGMADACTGYLFFDPVHPSGLAHFIMAQKTQVLLDEAGIKFQ